MSSQRTDARPVTLRTLRRMAERGEPFACLTCYDATTAHWLKRAGVHLMLVGDTAAEVVLGYDSTIHMPLNIAVALTAAVKRGAPSTVVMGDMPFMSYHTDEDDAVRNAARFLTEGRADLVKLEADASFAPLVAKMARAGIPVCGHVGAKPQHAALTAGYAAAGRTHAPAAKLYLRIALEVSVVAPALLDQIVWPGAAFAAVLLIAAGIVFARMPRNAAADLPDQGNPARVKTALTFGAIYVVVLFAVAAARDFIGNDAVYAVAFASGLTDVDALTLSMSRLFGDGKIEGDTAWRAIFLGSLSNLFFKTAFAATVGSASLRRNILATGIPALAAGAAILTLWP